MKYATLLQSALKHLQASHIADARLDAELLLAEACGLSRASLLAHLDDPISDEATVRFAELIERRARHEPVAYIRGHKEFYGLDLHVDRRVLIPRPETELLVERALKEIGSWKLEVGSWTVVNVGTGSGAIAIAIAHTLTADDRRQTAVNRLRSVVVIATDVSPAALAVAKANAARHGLSERIRFVQGDMLASIDVRADLIVANLPYIAHDEWRDLAPDIADYEPRLALDGGDDGLALFRTFFAQAPSHCAPNGAIMLEVGWRQADAVRALALAAFPIATIEVVTDGAGLDRVVIVKT